jgi:hypothetical protein
LATELTLMPVRIGLALLSHGVASLRTFANSLRRSTR